MQRQNGLSTGLMVGDKASRLGGKLPFHSHWTSLCYCSLNNVQLRCHFNQISIIFSNYFPLTLNR